MTVIQPIALNQAGPDTAPTLAAIKAKLGVVPNMMLTLANAPAALNAYVALSGAVAGGVLSAGQRESIAITVAQTNSCGYCLSAHTLLGKGAGLSAEDIRAARDANASTVKNQALLQLSKRIVDARGHLDAADIAAFRNAGGSDAEILETIANVALNIYTNYVNHIAGTEIDFPEVSLDKAA
ncbi:MAG: carboxymuconolactone decarboxylase family protein [Arenimonas sp.]